MPLLLIAGTFRPGTGVPDGDTVRFAPDNTNLLYRLARQGQPPNLNQSNATVPVRYEGIDAMERGARLPESAEATRNNLRFLGLDGPEAVGRGYLLSRLLDTNGRPICFAYPGSAISPDGSEVFLDVENMRNSANYRLLANGDAYPLFYDTLFQDLRADLVAVTEATRAARLGVWANDATTTGVTWAGRPSLATIPPIFPKLWRRLEDYTFDRVFRDVADRLDAFLDYLRQRRDRLLVLPEMRFTGLDNIVEVNGETVRLRYRPEQLVFRSAA